MEYYVNKTDQSMNESLCYGYWQRLKQRDKIDLAQIKLYVKITNDTDRNSRMLC